MQELLKKLKYKSVHIVGVTGAEGSAILRFLSENPAVNITVHDFISAREIEKSFKLWHKGITVGAKNTHYKQFITDLAKVKKCFEKDYLRNIDSADIIFVPQSWRLYREQNFPLWKAKNKNIPFYSLTRLYLDFSKATIVGITGTVGKGSTANILVQLLKAAGKNVYFGGNESWMIQVLDQLPKMTQKDILVLEISHRQLQDGFIRAPHIVVFTNLYPNHLDEVNWEEYKNLKLSLLKAQKTNDVAILNYDTAELKNLSDKLLSKVIFHSTKRKDMNIKSIQSDFTHLMSTNIIHYPANVLAAVATASLFNIQMNLIKNTITHIPSLPARLEKIGTVSGITFYDDIKSTTPWATLAAIEKLNHRSILICGGRTKGIDYTDFANKIKNKVKQVYCLNSQLDEQLKDLFSPKLYQTVNNLKQALDLAYRIAKKEDNILVSPGAGFFYSDFIKGKKSVRKIVTSLLPKEQV